MGRVRMQRQVCEVVSDQLHAARHNYSCFWVQKSPISTSIFHLQGCRGRGNTLKTEGVPQILVSLGNCSISWLRPECLTELKGGEIYFGSQFGGLHLRSFALMCLGRTLQQQTVVEESCPFSGWAVGRTPRGDWDVWLFSLYFHSGPQPAVRYYPYPE